jgi:hypothetical protein
VEAATSGTATIEVERQQGGYVDRMRAYKVLIDGEERGDVKRGETFSLEVEPGSHGVGIKIDWARSPVVEVECAAGQTVRLVCNPKSNPISALYHAFLSRSTYVDLRRV